MRVCDLAKALSAAWEGDGETQILRAAPIETAAAGEIAFVGNRKAADQAQSSKAACLIVPPEFPSGSGRTLIRSGNPRATFAGALGLLYPPPFSEPGIHSTAVVAKSAQVDQSAHIGAFVVLEDNVRIGARTTIGAGSTIGANSTIGEGSRLYPQVRIYRDVEVGPRAILHSGCVLGADGFGFAISGDHWEKFPQVGRVQLGSDVEIGANSCVDRAALGVTLIGDGCKLDNQVHIGHNCTIGKHVVIAAQTGLSGGVVVEDYAVIGGQVGIGDKARIGTRAVLGSGCGILTSKIVQPGQTVWGVPARPLREHLNQLAELARLGELRREVKELKARLEKLENTGS